MRIAIEVAGFSPAELDGFRRAMGTWRSSREMEKLHRQFVEGALRQPGMTEEARRGAVPPGRGVRELRVRQVACGGVRPDGLRIGLPQAVLPGPVPGRAHQRAADGLLPGRGARQRREAPRRGRAARGHQRARRTRPRPNGWAGPASRCRAGSGSRRDRSRPSRPPASIPSAAARERWTPEVTAGWGVRLGPAPGQGHRRAARGAARRGAGARAVSEPGRCRRADRAARGGPGAAHPDRWRWTRWGGRGGSCCGSCARWPGRHAVGWTAGRCAALGRAAGKRGAAAGRPMDLRLPATDAPALPAITESERIGDAYAVLGLDARRQVVGLFRPALDRLGAVTNAALADRRPGPVRIGGLVVTRQHPMTAKGTVFLALEDETGMVNVTLWPDTWAAAARRWCGGTRCCSSTGSCSARAWS